MDKGELNIMSKEATQELEKAMNTVFACRSVIKYNSMLRDEQKSELIAEIDSCLQFLCGNFITNASTQTHPARSLLPDIESGMRGKDERWMLQDLYRIYHACIDTKQSNNIGTFVVRFDATVSALNEIQQLLEKNQDQHMSFTEDPLHRIRAFIADIYYMFMELVRTLSAVLESNNVHLDAEESVDSELDPHSAQERQDVFSLRRLAPLANVFVEHQRLNKTKDALSSRIKECTTFLVYLEECLIDASHKRNEIASPLYNISILLSDLTYLVTNYEDAVSLVLSSS
jgi:hypothetical protein